MADIYGTAGADDLHTGGDDDNIYGELGNDKIYYGDWWGHLEGNDHIYGGLGNDTLVFYNGIESYDPVPDIDIDLAAGTAFLSLYGSSASLLVSGIENVTFSGDWGFEAWGDAKANRFAVGVGWGEFHGRGGNDLLDGGDGNDALYGDGGNDTLIGGGGDDTLVGGAGADRIEYLDWYGTDLVVDLAAGTSSGEGNDTLSGIENVTTGDGNDTVGGNGSANLLVVGAGNDVAEGLGGNDVLTGGSGNDWLAGGAGNDTLDGGSGFDVLEGGTGIDTLTGFHHADDFVFAPGDSGIGAGSRDVITDFSTVQGDDLDLTAFGGLSFIGQNVFSAPDQVRFIHSGGNTLVQLNTVGNSGMEMEIQLNGIVNMSAGDFLL